MSPDMIRQLPEGRALVVRGSLAPTVAKLPRAWKSRPLPAGPPPWAGSGRAYPRPLDRTPQHPADVDTTA